MKVLRLSVAVFTVGVLTSVLTLVNAISPNVIFSQCECDPDLTVQTFSSIVGTNAASITTVTTTTSSFVCSDGIAGTVDPTFPGTPGIVHSDTGTNGQFQANIDGAFVTGDNWFGVTSMELTSYRTGATVNIAVVGGQTLSAAVAGSSQVILTAAGSLAIKAINASALGRADFVFGKHSSLGAFICMVQPDFSISVCQNNAATFTSDSTMDLESYPGTVFSFFLGTPDFSAVTTLANLETFAASSVPVKPFAVPVPKTSISSPTTAEDTAVALDLTTSTFIANPTSATGLTFGVTLSNGAVSSGTLSSGIFGFTPSLNLNNVNTASFTQTFTVTLDNVCFSPSGSFQVSVSAVNDAPTATSPSSNVPVFASVNYDSTVSGNQLIIANDVDDGGVMIAGFAVIDAIPASGTIHQTCGSSALTVGGSLDIVNGNVVFCFKPGNTFLAGVTQSLLLTVHDDDTPPPGDLTAANQVTITFEGNDQFEVSSVVQVFSGFEDAVDGVSFNLSAFGENVAQSADDFFVVFESLSNLGTLQVEGVDAAENTPYDSSSSCTFSPNSGYFNRNGNDFTDFFSRPFNNCLVAQGCPITFSYSLSNSDGSIKSSLTQDVNIFIDAVDNEELNISGPATLIVENDVATGLNGVSVTADEGENVFPFSLDISSSSGVTFMWDPSVISTITSEPLSNHIDFVSGTECSSQFCTSASINSVSAVFSELLNTVKVNALFDSASPQLTIELFPLGSLVSGDVLEIAIEVFTSSPTDQPTNKPSTSPTSAPSKSPTVPSKSSDNSNLTYYYIGGGVGGGVIILALLVVAGVFFFKGGKSSLPETETSALEVKALEEKTETVPQPVVKGIPAEEEV